MISNVYYYNLGLFSWIFTNTVYNTDLVPPYIFQDVAMKMSLQQPILLLKKQKRMRRQVGHKIIYRSTSKIIFTRLFVYKYDMGDYAERYILNFHRFAELPFFGVWGGGGVGRRVALFYSPGEFRANYHMGVSIELVLAMKSLPPISDSDYFPSHLN